MLISNLPVVLAVSAGGWSLLYLLFGGGLGGAVILYIVLKAFGK
jgi:hypothetical protein